MKKVLIFYASYGGGHLSAAKSIKNYIDSNYSNVETNMVDCMLYINKFINKITTLAYKKIAQKTPWIWGKIYHCSKKGIMSRFSSFSNRHMASKLNKLIQEYNPDLIISTHPFSSQMCSFLKKQNKLNAVLATVMTDFAIHTQWIVGHENTEYFFVAHDGMKTELEKSGVLSSKIYVTGIPLSERFLINYDKKEILNSFDLTVNKSTVLFFGGGEFGLGKAYTSKILEVLIKNFPDIQVVAISGKNPKMKKEFENIVNKCHSQNRVRVLPFTDKVPELMSISSLVITKPGGLTTTESLASGLPMIIINPIPGQEEENAEFLESKNVAIWLKNNLDITDTISMVLSDNKKMNLMRQNAKLLSKINSTKNICNILLNNK